MKLEKISEKPLDYINDESSERKSLHDNPQASIYNIQTPISADDFVGVLDESEQEENNIEPNRQNGFQGKEPTDNQFDSYQASDINDEFKTRANDMLETLEGLFSDEERSKLGR